MTRSKSKQRLPVREDSPLFEPETSLVPNRDEPLEHFQARSHERVHLNGPQRTNMKPQNFKPNMVPGPSSSGLNIVPHKRKADEILDTEEDWGIDDGDDLVEPHDPDSEPLPDLPMYHPSVKTVELMCTHLIQDFHAFISKSAYQDDETEYLLKEAKELEHAPHESHILRFAVIGDAGQGKSSLLNSMLGHENLAIHAADGNSCTFVVVEYAQAPPTQKFPFQASVEFLSRQSCRELVKEQVQNFFQHLTMSEDVDEEEANEKRLASGTCITLLMALFMGEPEFQDKERAEDFLTSASSPDDPKLINKLMGWTEHILDGFMQNGDTNDVATLYANTSSSISEMIQPFTMTVQYPSFEGTELFCCPWPLVKKVRICMHSRILEQGIIIADLPGTTDKIRSRVEAAKRYLQTCDISIVVNKLDRAIDHASLHNSINESFRRRRSGNTIVVCTRSDDLNINSKQSFPSIPTEEKGMAEIMEKESELKERLHDIQVALASPGVRRHPLEKYKLVDKREKLDREKQSLFRKRFGIRVSARNRHVKQGIAEQYRQDTKDRSTLPIFCVSNPIYMQHLGGHYPKKNPPDLELDSTEIPALRNFIFSKPSQGRFASLEHYCRSLLPTFFNTIEISCSVSKIKRKDDLNRTFHKARGSLKATVQDVADSFAQFEFDLVYKTIAKNELKWINRGRRKCEKWSQLKPAGFTAVIRHCGTWGTKKCPQQNWNPELLSSVQEDLDPVFESLYNTKCDNLSTEISERVGEAVEKLNDALKVDPAASLSGAIEAFRNNLKERRNQIDKLCEKFRGQIKKEIRQIHVRAITDDEGHYLTEAMKEVYSATMSVKATRGQRVHDARSAALTRGITTLSGTFMKISHGVRGDFDKMFKEHINKLIKDLDIVFLRTQHDVSLVCSTKEDDSPDAKKMREELLAKLPDARQHLQDEIWKHLGHCKMSRT
ncbi:uncharacterized protein K460DRAFT_416455 [Cucurbitaria berberidis CBS 394.84]|uniref:G domain-containing protein n=1 Tax=Cucurbitaria berberidis CBS 394.84 TaxID=1168544 RepID=A0A9P4GGR1_9PLEO|nr:uncharacterized protein K460DRAFT_416455 [Cucurbitaria berberidis CBS 394.84]KAF1845146.1 hypothetical protein K460DRAFT_416455 [Cucurbitaria berberidis CBS 394.84]